jgi:hypothetical protein
MDPSDDQLLVFLTIGGFEKSPPGALLTGLQLLLIVACTVMTSSQILSQ